MAVGGQTDTEELKVQRFAEYAISCWPTYAADKKHEICFCVPNTTPVSPKSHFNCQIHWFFDILKPLAFLCQSQTRLAQYSTLIYLIIPSHCDVADCLKNSSQYCNVNVITLLQCNRHSALASNLIY